MDEAIRAAKATGADVLVTPFKDPIGRDAIIQWIGGVTTQLYWHTTAPSYASLQSIPENRVYVSLERVEAFVSSLLAFSRGSLVSNEPRAPDVEIGRPTESYRRVAKYHADAAYQIAAVYAFRNQSDEAFEWLERAYAQRDSGLIETKMDPLLKNLHKDPRYTALLKKLKLPN